MNGHRRNSRRRSVGSLSGLSGHSSNLTNGLKVDEPAGEPHVITEDHKRLFEDAFADFKVHKAESQLKKQMRIEELVEEAAQSTTKTPPVCMSPRSPKALDSVFEDAITAAVAAPKSPTKGNLPQLSSSIVVFDGKEYTSKYRNTGKTHYICHFCFYEVEEDAIRYVNHITKCLDRHDGQHIADVKNTRLAYECEDNNRFLYANSSPTKLFACRLCHLSRFFVGTKTPNDTYADKFEYFMLYNREKSFMGYFSKEIAAEATEMFSLSCLLIMPKFGRQGHGKFLIDFSYKLAKLKLDRADVTVSPERPLTDHGLLSYRSYWRDCILIYILQMIDQHEVNKQKMLKSELLSANIMTSLEQMNRFPKFSIKQLTDSCFCNSNDLISTMQWFGWLKQLSSFHGTFQKSNDCFYRNTVLPTNIRDGSYFVVIDNDIIDQFILKGYNQFQRNAANIDDINQLIF